MFFLNSGKILQTFIHDNVLKPKYHAKFLWISIKQVKPRRIYIRTLVSNPFSKNYAQTFVNTQLKSFGLGNNNEYHKSVQYRY